MLPVAIFICIGWILSVCLHEFGHAVVAYWGGDTSVKDKGYLTLNPLKYTNLNLSLMLPLLFLLMGGIALPGAAVYINQGKLRNRWWQSAVSAAGPMASGIVTLLLAIAFHLSLALRHTQYWWLCPALACLIFLQIYVIIINSLPIPSLDGYGVIEPWLPRKIQSQLAKYSTTGFILLFMLLWFVKPVGLFFGNASTTIAQSLGVPSIAIAAGFALFSKSSGILLITVIGIIFLVRRIMRKPHEVCLDRGNAFKKSGRYEKAIAIYDKAIQTKLNHYEIWYKRGRLLTMLDRDEEAVFSYSKAIKIKPEFEESWHYRGLTLIKLKRYEKAITSYNKVIQLNPDFEKAWFFRGLALHYLKKYEAAVNNYDKAIQINPENLDAWRWRGMALYGLQRYEEAIASYEQVIQIKPDEPDAWNYKGCALVKLERYEEALTANDQAIQLKPDNPDAWTNRGDALYRLQRYKEALVNHDKAIELKQNCYLAWFNRGGTLGKMQRYKEALKSYIEVIKVKPDDSFDWSLKGIALHKLQQTEEAITCCNRAIQIDPKCALAWYGNACCYAKQNNIDLAIENLKQAISFDSHAIKEEAKTESSFDSIRNNQLFKDLIDTDAQSPK